MDGRDRVDRPSQICRFRFSLGRLSVEKTSVAVNLAEQPDSKTPAQSGVRRVFRKESPWSHLFGTAIEQIRSQKAVLVGLLAVSVFLLVLIGFAIGGGFSNDEAASTTAGDYFITVEQADQLRQQATELQETKSQLAIVEGEAAYLRSEAAALSGDIESLQQSFNGVQVEMSIIVGIYEECMARLYPAECVAAARPRAEEFLAELFASTP